MVSQPKDVSQKGENGKSNPDKRTRSKTLGKPKLSSTRNKHKEERERDSVLPFVLEIAHGYGEADKTGSGIDSRSRRGAH